MDVHYVENENITVAFFPETKRFFKVNKNAILLINAIISGKEKEQILSDFNISSEDCDIYYNNIYGGITKPTAIITEKSKKRILNRLVIHLTNDCNMRCKYCYANKNPRKAFENFKYHDPYSPLLLGHVKPDDTIIQGAQKSFQKGKNHV